MIIIKGDKIMLLVVMIVIMMVRIIVMMVRIVIMMVRVVIMVNMAIMIVVDMANNFELNLIGIKMWQVIEGSNCLEHLY